MKGIAVLEIIIILAILGIIASVAFPQIQDYNWLHDNEHPERLERWNTLHDKQGVKDSQDCLNKKRLLKQEC